MHIRADGYRGNIVSGQYQVAPAILRVAVMDLKDSFYIVIYTITGILGIVGLFGWSHKSLKDRITNMEIEILKRPDYSDLRRYIGDKLAPMHVEFGGLSSRMDELRQENDKLNEKLDEILVLCTKLAHEAKIV